MEYSIQISRLMELEIEKSNNLKLTDLEIAHSRQLLQRLEIRYDYILGLLEQGRVTGIDVDLFQLEIKIQENILLRKIWNKIIQKMRGQI